MTVEGHDRPITKIMHGKIMQCWHILTACKSKSDKNTEQQRRAKVSYKISCVWETSLVADSGGYKLTFNSDYFIYKMRISQ